jgi:signal transduction histidine kinase
MAGSLEQAERRRLELVGNVAHELRTPIATLEGYLEGLLDGMVEPSPETWARLHDEAGRLRRLVDDLQELSRAEARQLALVVRPTAPADLVGAAIDRLSPAFEEKGLALRTRVASDLPLVLADADRAIQVLTNLLTNALRYTPAGGSVTLRAEASDGAVTFQVEDTGLGFAPELRDRLFERFYRVDPSRSRALGGSGIGLTISKALVEAMGGRIWAESAGPGRGSCFAFTLPRAR